MKLVYGTTNKGKIGFMQKRVERVGIEILSLDDLGAPKLDIVECGNSPLENARIKASAYYNALKMPVFSCDSGLYIDELDDSRQPGLNVRGINDDMNDNAALAYYSGIADEFGGKVTARYVNAICLVYDENRIFEHMGNDIASEPFYFISKPHKKREEGFPLDCISIHIESGKYYYDIDGYQEKYLEADDGYVKFFQKFLDDINH